MASIIGKLKKETKNKIIHSTFELGRSVLDALEEQMISEPEEKDNVKQPQ